MNKYLHMIFTKKQPYTRKVVMGDGTKYAPSFIPVGVVAAIVNSPENM